MGCSASQSDLVVRGAVTFDGEEIAKGKILLMPIDESKTHFVTTIGAGKYSFAKQRVVPGSYQVQIFGYEGTGKFEQLGGIHGDEKREVEIQVIPSEFNSQTKLKIEITDDPNESYDFSLKS